MENRIDNNEIKPRHWAADICDKLEDFLSDYDLYIPDDNRTGDEDEACLYGDSYSCLESFVTELLLHVNRKSVRDCALKIEEEFNQYITEGVKHCTKDIDFSDLVPCHLESDIEPILLEYIETVKSLPNHRINQYDY